MDYISIMQQHENACLSQTLKAEQERQLHAGRHTKAECVYLQEAARIRGEMARMSTGFEKQHQLNQKKELDMRIRRIVMELTPDAISASKKVEEDPDDFPTAVQDENADDENSVSDKAVAKWFVKDTSHGFDEVVGMSETIAQLRDCVADMKHPLLRQRLQMTNTHGFLLFGPPGCGKTFIANAFAHELLQKDYKFMKLVGADILSKYVGEAEQVIQRLFQEALKNAPCIVFIDEIDSLCKNRSIEGLPEYASSITTAFLNGYNSITDRPASDPQKAIIFICATNYPNMVDDAMVDRVKLVRIPLPDQEARSSAFEHKLRMIIRPDNDISYEEMAKITSGYNRRDIDRLVEIICANAHKELSAYSDQQAVDMLDSGEYCLTRDRFMAAFQKCIPSPKDNILREQEEWEARLHSRSEE